MDTTTQYKLNKYSKKINNAYQQNNIAKVNEYMQHQFSYINKYAQHHQQQGGSLEEIQRALENIEQAISKLIEETTNNFVLVQELNEATTTLQPR
jgi:hypothetical protein